MNTQQPQPHAVILHGPPGADLIQISRALADTYDCDHVIDSFTPLKSPLVPRGLHLATRAPDPARFAPDIRILSLDAARLETFNRAVI